MSQAMLLEGKSEGTGEAKSYHNGLVQKGSGDKTQVQASQLEEPENVG